MVLKSSIQSINRLNSLFEADTMSSWLAGRMKPRCCGSLLLHKVLLLVF